MTVNVAELNLENEIFFLKTNIGKSHAVCSDKTSSEFILYKPQNH